MNKVDAVAPELAMRHSEASLDAPLSHGPTITGGFRAVRRLVGFASRLSDAQLALTISVVLFAATAWPLALTEVPPYQDLPNHLAAVTVIEHPAQYPEFVFNGFFKTNAALFTWLVMVGRVVGAPAAAKLFALLVLAANAIVLPRFVVELTNRRRLVVAAFFIWPMIHNWFVSMGMLDFALGFSLSLLALILLNRQRVAPSLKTAFVLGGVALLTWYAHVMPLMVVLMLVAIHVALRPRWVDRIAQAKALILPMVPAALLVAVSLYKHWTEPAGKMTGYVELGTLLPTWELFYNLWAEWFYGFTWLSITTLVPCIGLGLIGIWRAKKDVPFFSPVALAALTALFVFSPYIATNWFHVNSRFIPFIWAAFLLRLPDRMPKPAYVVLGACAVPYFVGMGVDFVRLDQDRAKFTAGISAVPEGAKLLPLIFKRKMTSENTRSLLHAWGYYVMEKETSAPLLFAHSASFPVMYAEPPPPQFNHLVLESFAPSMATPDWTCNVLRAGGVVVADCDAMWRARWAEFWTSAEPAFDHVLMWDAPAPVKALIPADYTLTFEQDRLSIYERKAHVASTP
jgi:hypothetical protein